MCINYQGYQILGNQGPSRYIGGGRVWAIGREGGREGGEGDREGKEVSPCLLEHM